jgi:hypothetical protein
MSFIRVSLIYKSVSFKLKTMPGISCQINVDVCEETGAALT